VTGFEVQGDVIDKRCHVCSFSADAQAMMLRM
jgi:hypothetical protein